MKGHILRKMIQFRMSPMEDIEADLKEARGGWGKGHPRCMQQTPSGAGQRQYADHLPGFKTVWGNPAGNWKEESEKEMYREVRALVEGLEIPAEFAALGASNAFQLHGVLPEDKKKLLL